MTDLDDRVRTLLEERAREHVIDPQLPRAVALRSRRRRALVGASAGLGAVAAIVLGAAALRTFGPTEETGHTPSPTPVVEAWRGIWPQTTRGEAEAAQTAADAGDVDAIWQLDAGEVAMRFARDELGFVEGYFDESFDIAEEDSPGPYVVHVISCEPRDLVEWPPVCAEGEGVYSEVTIERLLRADRTGIWSVTAALPATPTAAEPQPSPEPVPGYPDTFVGITNEGDLVLASVADGEVIRTLLDREPFDLALGSSAFSPDGSWVYVTARAGTNDPRILRVPLAGGEPEVVARGSAPAMSRDGRLAFSACGVDGCGTEVEVEMSGGSRTRLDVSRFVEEGVGAIAWLPDGRLAVSISYPGDSGADVRVVDPSSPPEHLLDLPPFGRGRVGDSWLVLGYHVPTGSVAIHSACCSGYATDPIESQQVLAVDPDTGEPGAALVSDAAYGVTLDRTGRFFLVPERSEDGTLTDWFLLERDGGRRPLGGEVYYQVAW
jgi:hypothetical protein